MDTTRDTNILILRLTNFEKNNVLHPTESYLYACVYMQHVCYTSITFLGTFFV